MGILCFNIKNMALVNGSKDKNQKSHLSLLKKSMQKE